VDLATAISTIVTHVTAAAAAVDSAWTDVADGEPIPGGQRSIRVAYAGSAAPGRMGETYTLDSEMKGEQILIGAFWAMADASTTSGARRNVEARTLEAELRTRLNGDATLGGTVTDLLVGDAQTDWPVINGTQYRAMRWVVTLDYSEYTRAA